MSLDRPQRDTIRHAVDARQRQHLNVQNGLGRPDTFADVCFNAARGDPWIAIDLAVTARARIERMKATGLARSRPAAPKRG